MNVTTTSNYTAQKIYNNILTYTPHFAKREKSITLKGRFQHDYLA